MRRQSERTKRDRRENVVTISVVRGVWHQHGAAVLSASVREVHIADIFHHLRAGKYLDMQLGGSLFVDGVRFGRHVDERLIPASSVYKNADMCNVRSNAV